MPTNVGVSGPQTAQGAIDPATGKPYYFGLLGGDSLHNWNFGRNLGGGSDAGENFDPNDGWGSPEFLHSIGFDDPAGASVWIGGQDGGSNQTNPAFRQFLQDRGLRLGVSNDGPESDRWARGRAFDAQGNPVGIEDRWRGDENDDAFLAAMLAGGVFAGAGAAGAFGGTGAFGTGAAVDGAGGMALAEGAYPTALSSGAGGGIPAGLAGANGQLLTAEQIASLQGATQGIGGIAPEVGSSVTWGAPTAGFEGAGAATNAALADSAVGSSGYGASSAGLGGGVGDLAGIAGPTAGSGSWLSTLQGGDVLGALQQGGSSALDWVIKNPGTALTLGGAAAGALGGHGGSSGGSSYTPKALDRGNWQASLSPMLMPVPQSSGLLSAGQGQPNSGLWQYMSGQQQQRPPKAPGLMDSNYPPNFWSK